MSRQLMEAAVLLTACFILAVDVEANPTGPTPKTYEDVEAALYKVASDEMFQANMPPISTVDALKREAELLETFGRDNPDLQSDERFLDAVQTNRENLEREVGPVQTKRMTFEDVEAALWKMAFEKQIKTPIYGFVDTLKEEAELLDTYRRKYPELRSDQRFLKEIETNRRRLEKKGNRVLTQQEIYHIYRDE